MENWENAPWPKYEKSKKSSGCDVRAACRACGSNNSVNC